MKCRKKFVHAQGLQKNKIKVTGNYREISQKGLKNITRWKEIFNEEKDF